MTTRLAWIAIAVLAAYAVFIGGAWFGLYQPALRLISVTLAAVVLATWVYVARRDPEWRPRSLLLPAIAACLGSLAVSTAFSRYPGISLEYLAYAILLAALYLLLVQLLARDFFRRRFLTLTTGLFTAIVAVYVALTVSHWINWLTVLGRVTVPPLRPEFESLTFGNPSTLLTIVALLAVPIVGAASWTSRRGLATAVIVIGLVGGVALASGSRAGWLALAVAGVVAVVVTVMHPGGRRAIRDGVRKATSRTAGRVALLSLGVVMVGAILALAPAVIRRATEGGEALRLVFVRIALELFAQSPIVGTGPGTWVIQRPGLTRPNELDDYIPHAHNIYAQTLAELGLVGALAGGILIASLVTLIAGAVRGRDPSRARWGWVTLIGLVYFAAHQVLDFYANFPAVLFAAALPVAYLDATAPSAEALRPRESWRRMGGRTSALGGVVLAVALLLLGAQELPALSNNLAVERANTGDWAAADAPAREAARQDPRVSSYLFTAGLTAAHAGDHQAAATFFREVASRDDLPEAWLNLAAEQAALGDTDSARASIQSALRVGHQRTAVSIPAGELALRIGDTALGEAAFTSAVLITPSFLGDPWWEAEPNRAASKLRVVESALRAAPPHVAWELALMAGDAEEARQLASSSGMSPSPVDFVDAWGGDDAAYGRLLATCSSNALQLNVLFWCARVEGRRGNVESANDYRYLANAQIGGAYRAGAELRVLKGEPVGRSLEGNPAIFWGTYTYRRFTPWDILVPSLLHLTLE